MLCLIEVGFVEVFYLILVNPVVVLVHHCYLPPQRRLKSDGCAPGRVLWTLLPQQKCGEVYVDRVNLLLRLQLYGLD